MRLIAILALVAFGAGTCFAEAADAASDKGKEASAKADAKAVNTVCVACGHAVDAKVAPIAGKTKEGKDVMIGCCTDACAAKVKATPNDYADAAVQNKAWKKEEQVK